MNVIIEKAENEKEWMLYAIKECGLSKSVAKDQFFGFIRGLVSIAPESDKLDLQNIWRVFNASVE